MTFFSFYRGRIPAAMGDPSNCAVASEPRVGLLAGPENRSTAIPFAADFHHRLVFALESRVLRLVRALTGQRLMAH
jgi:hypothetical protein